MLAEEFMAPLGLDAVALAHALDVPEAEIAAVVAGQRRVTAALAAGLARRFGTTAQFWLNLQSAYDASIAGEKTAPRWRIGLATRHARLRTGPPPLPFCGAPVEARALAKEPIQPVLAEASAAVTVLPPYVMAHSAPGEASAPKPVCFALRANPGMQNDLVALGFLADTDRGNPDAVMEATVQLIREGVNLFKDLERLFASLRESKRRLDAQQDGGRQAALHALDAVVRYLMLFQRTHVDRLLTPLALLFEDLVSLDGGQVRRMVAPSKKRGGTYASGFYNALKGIAVFITLRLEASGMARVDARKAVAKELSKLGVQPARRGAREGSGEISARTIGTWQEAIAEDVGFKKTAAQEFRQCEAGNVRRVLAASGLADLPEGSTADELELNRVGPTEFRRAHLHSLAKFVLATRLAPRKST
jgi:addiction module HigA family antidote